MSLYNQSDYNPSLRWEDRTLQTWSTGNTYTITDARIKSRNVILIIPVSGFDGHIAQTVTDGQCILTTSSATENTNTFYYEIL